MGELNKLRSQLVISNKEVQRLLHQQQQQEARNALIPSNLASTDATLLQAVRETVARDQQSTPAGGTIERATLVNYQNTLNELERRLVAVQQEKQEAISDAHKYRQQLGQAQDALRDSENTTRDFVQLSQKLQMDLEKMRLAEQVCAFIVKCAEYLSLLRA